MTVTVPWADSLAYTLKIIWFDENGLRPDGELLKERIRRSIQSLRSRPRPTLPLRSDPEDEGRNESYGKRSRRRMDHQIL